MGRFARGRPDLPRDHSSPRRAAGRSDVFRRCLIVVLISLILQGWTVAPAARMKRLHVFHRMSQSPGGDVVATSELMFLHVNIVSERVTPMPPERWQAASRLAAAHAALATPANAGRRVQLRRP